MRTTSNRRRRSRSDGRWLFGLLGFLGGLAFRSGTLGKALLTGLGVLSFVAFGKVAAWWDGLGPGGRVLVGLAAVSVVVLWAGRRWGWQVPVGPVREPERGRPRTLLPAVWVYMIHEYRDAVTEELLPLEAGRLRGRRHLVYVGKTVDFDARMAQHRAEKLWWHDELEFTLPGQFWTEADALVFEASTIRWAARSEQLADRPRENREHNPTYDPARCALLRGKTSRELTAA